MDGLQRLITFLSIAAMFESAGIAGAQTSTPSRWEKEPDSYRSVRWEATKQEAEEKLGSLTCSRMENSAGKPDLCFGPSFFRRDFEIAGVSIRDSFYFVDGKFVKADLIFDSPGYDTLKDVFIAKYGRPSVAGILKEKTKMGAEYENEVLKWE